MTVDLDGPIRPSIDHSIQHIGCSTCRVLYVRGITIGIVCRRVSASEGHFGTMARKAKTSQSLKAEKSRLESILVSAVDAIITINSNALIESVNPAAEKLFQYDRDEFLGRNVKFLMPEPHSSKHDDYVQRYQATGERKIIGIGREVTGMRKDGSTFPMHLSVSEFEVDGQKHFTGIIHDLSEQKDAERALQHSHRMEAIGQLTGGVAHDFNNLLTVIVGNLELLEMTLKDDDQRVLLQEAQEAAELGARLTDRLLAFARRSYLEPQTVDLNTLVLGLTDLLHRTLGEQIDLSSSLSVDLWPVRADPSQIESAIVNLAVNARDAMERGGKLVIETRNSVLDENYAATEIGVEPGPYVQLSVSDTGSGMSKDIQQRAFEPFFTTKEAGRGTGLGLSMVFGFAKQSGGHATIYSELGKGTTMNLYLPRLAGEAELTKGEGPETAIRRGAGEVVLVVEDDDRVRRLTLNRLIELGYRVIEASSGTQALDIIQDGNTVDLVFTDIVMPGGMSGYELSEKLQQSRSGMKLLLTSGYAEDQVHGDRLASRHLRILRKPYRQTELARIIREVLDRD